MSNYAIILDVMFGIYLMNLIRSILGGEFFLERPRLVMWLDRAIGVLLLLLVIGAS